MSEGLKKTIFQPVEQPFPFPFNFFHFGDFFSIFEKKCRAKNNY